ncbi:aspartate dehydrogenase [Loktanella sp. DSM 29012]|uniref:aspartate dehydrogenase n=1 Tax=Loktanella sp. DSM 29012 TaxID=1881056 RepID=UPI0008BF3AAF|nr:aspartate dehydrogenase [Loktanella sp. DSM 29012]SEQ83475.1 aspartate dehydrogenase [Loktanella sp. DSM 29012]
MKIGLIGFGSIGREVHARLSQEPEFSFCALTRSAIVDAPKNLRQFHDRDPFLATAPDLVVECAGHSAVVDHAEALLLSGCPLLIASLGSLADAALSARLTAAAKTAGARLIYPSGAIGALDVLRAVAAEGSVEVRYTGTKPPSAWVGSPAENLCDLSALTQPCKFFSGTAREAAKGFPKNANVVAALALAGPGFDAVQVDLVADPASRGNTHSYMVTSAACVYDFRIENAPSPSNPRTSLTTILSIVESIRAFSHI